MSGISYDTYQRLGAGVRYYNMNLGHQATGMEALPSLNPFQGLTQDDIDEHILAELESQLSDATALLENADAERIAQACDVSNQSVVYAQDGVEKALSAIEDAWGELNC